MLTSNIASFIILYLADFIYYMSNILSNIDVVINVAFSTGFLSIIAIVVSKVLEYNHKKDISLWKKRKSLCDLNP